MTGKIKLNKIIGLILICLTFNIQSYESAFASKFSSNISKKQLSHKDSNKDLKSEYLLGPGDVFLAEFIGLEIFSNKYSVDRDGNVFLPEIGKTKVDGLTIKEITGILIDKYENFIMNPEINISLIKYRPVYFTINGEIQSPGLYNLKYEFEEVNSFNMNNTDTLLGDNNINSNRTRLSRIPRLFDAIQLGNGFTEFANLREIIVIRDNSKSEGGGKISTKINLVSLLENGDMSQNIVLQDGDNINIQKDPNPIIEQLNAIYRSNVTPPFIKVFVNGNVNKPGLVQLNKGSTLIEAIAASGGQKNNTGKVEFIRLKSNEKADKRIFSYNSGYKKGSKQNPILYNGDIIHVRKNILGKTTSAIEEISNPLFSGYGLIKLFD